MHVNTYLNDLYAQRLRDENKRYEEEKIREMRDILPDDVQYEVSTDMIIYKEVAMHIATKSPEVTVVLNIGKSSVNQKFINVGTAKFIIDTFY